MSKDKHMYIMENTTLYGYKIKDLILIAKLLETSTLTPETIHRRLNNITEVIEAILDERKKGYDEVVKHLLGDK